MFPGLFGGGEFFFDMVNGFGDGGRLLPARAVHGRFLTSGTPFGMRALRGFRNVGVGNVGFRVKFGELLFGNVSGDGIIRAEGFTGESFELLETGEFVKIAQTEAHEKFFGGFVKDGAADDFFASGGGDELLVEESGDNPGGVDAADFGNFGGGDGLLVGDDRKSFEGGHGEAKGRAKRLDEAANDVVVLGFGVHLVAPSDGANLDAAIVGGIGGDELLEGSLDGELVLTESSGQLVECGGLIGSVDNGFESGFEFEIGHRSR